MWRRKIGLASSGLGRVWPVGKSFSHRAPATPVAGRVSDHWVFPLLFSGGTSRGTVRRPWTLCCPWWSLTTRWPQTSTAWWDASTRTCSWSPTSLTKRAGTVARPGESCTHTGESLAADESHYLSLPSHSSLARVATTTSQLQIMNIYVI